MKRRNPERHEIQQLKAANLELQQQLDRAMQDIEQLTRRVDDYEQVVVERNLLAREVVGLRTRRRPRLPSLGVACSHGAGAHLSAR